MRIAEVYSSLQGEGLLTGTQSVFVRASGCNLRCGFCDTPHASWRPEGDDLSVYEILRRVVSYDPSHVVITGGEPMLFSELIPLCEGIRRREIHITIETAGTLYLPLACDLMSISPKMSNSTPMLDQAPNWIERHERTRCSTDLVRRLVAEYSYQMKFVIDRPSDCEEVEGYLDQFPQIDRSRVLLMPQGIDPAALEATGQWLSAYCQSRGYKFCPRKQIEWFGLKRGT